MAEVDRAAEKAFEEATRADNGMATAPPPTPAPAEPATEAAEPEAAPAAPAEPDPWDPIKTQYTPDQITEFARIANDRRAMESASHRRNEEAGRRVSRAEELERQVESVKEWQRSTMDSIGAIAADNPEYAGQMLKLFHEAAQRANGAQPGAGRPYQQAAPQPPGPDLSAIQQRMEYMEAAFNHREVLGAAYTAAANQKILQEPTAKKLGLSQRVVEEAVADVYAAAQRDRAEGRTPSVNPLDPMSVSSAVGSAIQKRASYYEQLVNGTQIDRRGQQAAVNKTAPPSTRGPTASVRSAQNPAAPPPSNLSGPEREREWIKKFAQASGINGADTT